MRERISRAAPYPIGCTGITGSFTDSIGNRSASLVASRPGVSGSPMYGSVIREPRWMQSAFAHPPPPGQVFPFVNPASAGSVKITSPTQPASSANFALYPRKFPP